MTAADVVGESPVRLQRDVEQKNLEDLNARLEKYIFKQRAKDASREAFEKDLAKIQQQTRQAINANTKKYEEQLRLMRQQRDEHASAREELQIRVSRQEAVISRVKDQLTEEKKYQNDLNQQTSALKAQLEEANSKNCKMQDQLRKSMHALKVAESAGRSAEEQLVEAREAADKSSHEASSLRAKCKSLEQDLSISGSVNESEIKKLKETIDKLQAQIAITEDNCRSEFSTQLAKIVEDYRKQCNEDKTRVTRELKGHYMPKLTELRHSIDEALRRENDLREANTALVDQVSQLRQEVQSLVDIKTVQEKRIQELVAELDRERNFTHVDVIATKDKEIERLRQECQRLECDFDDLMDIKIQLALTIEKYRELLSEEEHRLGLETPGRKRKRTKRAPEGPTLQLSVHDQSTNCLLVKNVAAEAVNMDTFALKSGSFIFNFPSEMKVPAYGEICVWIGEEVPEVQEEGNERTLHVAWENVDPEDMTSEPMKLYDSKGSVIDQLEVETVKGGDLRNDGSSCLIM